MLGKRFKAIHGTKDILPEQAGAWGRVISTVARVASTYNYGFIQPPIFEATELFARGIGETSDIVTKEMYTFKDLGNRSLTLRPEATASVVRAYLEHSMGKKEGLVKVWYAGPMFRQERPQAGRLRQFYQFGMEAIGSLDPGIDAELIEMNYRIFLQLGIDNLKVSLNSIGMPEDRQRHRKAFSNFVEPKLDRFCDDCRKRYRLNPLRMFDCKQEACQTILQEAPVVFDFLSKENLEHFKRVTECLEITAVPFELNKTLVRGLDYYTRTAWEITCDRLGSQDSLSGGGRYDLLVEQLGGEPTPGIGFAAGMERILMAMPPTDDTEALRKSGCYIAVRDEKFKAEAFRLATKLRALGLRTELDHLGRSLKAQMKQADKSRMEYALILAEDEMARKSVVVRNLDSSRQFELELDLIYNLSNARQFGEIVAERSE